MSTPTTATHYTADALRGARWMIRICTRCRLLPYQVWTMEAAGTWKIAAYAPTEADAQGKVRAICQAKGWRDYA